MVSTPQGNVAKFPFGTPLLSPTRRGGGIARQGLTFFARKDAVDTIGVSVKTRPVVIVPHPPARVVSTGLIYCVKASGTAANKAAAVAASSAACTTAADSAAMSVATFNTETFSPGDTVYFSATGGDFTTEMRPLSSGTADAYITYEGLGDGIDGEYPHFDMNDGGITFDAGLYITLINYAYINNFNVTGSGDLDGVTFKSGAGSAGDGYTIELDNVHVLSNDIVTNGDDGFGIWGTSEVIVKNSSAKNCWRSDGIAQSNSCLSMHESAKARLYNFTCSDSQGGISGIDAATLLVDGLTASGITGSIVELRAGALGTGGTVLIENAAIDIDVAGGFLSTVAGADATATLTLSNSTVNITGGKIDTIYGINIYLESNTFTINSPDFQMMLLDGAFVGAIQNHFTLTDYNTYLFRIEQTTAEASIVGNFFDGSGGVWDHILRTNGTAIFDYNVVRHSATGEVLWVRSDTAGNTRFCNNVIYDIEGTETIIDNDLGVGPTVSITVSNNIFVGVSDIYNGANGLTLSNNCYYNSENAGGVGSITTDPLFVDPASNDFHLQSNSPCIGTGADPFINGDGDQYDADGYMVWSDTFDAPVYHWRDGVDIGAYAYGGADKVLNSPTIISGDSMANYVLEMPICPTLYDADDGSIYTGIIPNQINLATFVDTDQMRWGSKYGVFYGTSQDAATIVKIDKYIGNV